MAAPMKLKLRFCCKNKALLTSSVSSHLKQYARTLNGKTARNSSDESAEIKVDSEGFRYLKLRRIESSKFGRPMKRSSYVPAPGPPPRSTKMPVNQDWTNVWPTAQSFKWSVVPMPLRQGVLKRNSEAKGDGFPPEKRGNTELIKIPNFLHLTPKHIEKQCAAIKKFCTPWPEGLETAKKMHYHFPVGVITEDFCFSSSSVRDPRARLVTMRFKMSDLELDEHAKDKMQKLLGSRDDLVELKSDRCPLKKQNYDFLQYILTALYFESWTVEPWESSITRADYFEYSWTRCPSQKNTIDLLNTYRRKDESCSDPDKRQLPYMENELKATKKPIPYEPVKEYQSAVEDLHNSGENIETVNNYKESVLKLLNVQRKASQSW